MDRNEILKQIDLVIAQTLQHHNFSLSESTTAKDIKGWDSLNHMSLMAAIEKHFEIKFSFIEILNMTDVGSMIDCLQDKQ